MFAGKCYCQMFCVIVILVVIHHIAVALTASWQKSTVNDKELSTVQGSSVFSSCFMNNILLYTSVVCCTAFVLHIVKLI